MNTNLILSHCKTNKERFVKLTPDGFVSSRKVAIKAGMQFNKAGVYWYPIKTVGYKTVFFVNKIHPDNDIQLISEYSELIK